jgi:hypothetical protein|uniref:Uncharacterized protein n=1 Tax=Picea sitchensis TaxID=3332 RepID=A0A6B9XWX3_PICSI|nr:hypothetical protein Q903MT_gene5817 [Picea sitchensis]
MHSIFGMTFLKALAQLTRLTGKQGILALEAIPCKPTALLHLGENPLLFPPKETSFGDFPLNPD